MSDRHAPRAGLLAGAHTLPIDPLLPQLVDVLGRSPAVVVEAPPGAGKTTRIPGALLDAGFAAKGEIVVLQPRRLPARLAAMRVAEERGERVGDTVGYTVRFEDVSGPRTRIRFVTEGILLRRLMATPELPGVAAVVLDEFHERHVTTDLTLALLRRLQGRTRPDLKLCVMSATLDAEPVAAFLGGAPRLRSEGRRFEVAVEHAPPSLRDGSERKLEEQVVGAVKRALTQMPEGDVLVFLPGVGEIRRATEALEPLASAADLLLLPLHGDLPLGDQARAVARAQRRKVILSTNVAETSVTIDGVTAVIDTGLARIAGHSPWTGLPTLTLAKISQASAAQRAGRAGRTAPGLALRLYTRADHDSRPRHDTPEIARSDLAETVLALAALGVSEPARFDWLTPPPSAALASATELLRRLGALSPTGTLTELGQRLARFPAHPRLARMLAEAEERGVTDDAATAAALIAERDIRARTDGRESGVDLVALLETFEAARAARFARDRLRTLGLDPRATAQVDQARRQFLGATDARRRQHPVPADRLAQDRALARVVLTGFPDRVARRRAGGSRAVLLASGGTAELGYEADSEFLVALDVAERGRAGGNGAGGPGSAGSSVRLGCGIDPDWLADLDAGDLHASEVMEFEPATERVVRRSRLTYGTLVLDEAVLPAEPSEETSAVLAAAALARGVDAFDEPGALDRLRGRLAVVREIAPDLDLPSLDGDSLRTALATACDGLRSFSELRTAGLVERLTNAFPSELRARLAGAAPPTITLSGGRTVPIHYQSDRPPWIESRLQDFFGLARTPAIGGGRVPLTLHLLAPNQRAVQVTRDLESFWRQHYPPLRRELGRRYPRHAWPEDGLTATPPPPPPRRPPRA